MLRSRQVLPVLLLVAFIGLATFSAVSFRASPLDVATYVVFGVALATAAYIWLPASGKPIAPSRFRLPRWILVLFASYAAAFGLAMLIAVAAMPWASFRAFDFFFGSGHSWALLVLGVLLFPFIRRRLR